MWCSRNFLPREQHATLGFPFLSAPLFRFVCAARVCGSKLLLFLLGAAEQEFPFFAGVVGK